MRQPKAAIVNRCLVAPLGVGHLVKNEPALVGEAVALGLDGDVVPEFVAQLEDERFDGRFGLTLHRLFLVRQDVTQLPRTTTGK